jgi:Xaa-Pro aminopeptidase
MSPLQPFSDSEIEARFERFLRGLDDYDVNVALIHSVDNICYLTGVPLLSEWGRPLWLLVRRNGDALLIGAEIEMENMRSSPTVESCATYDDSRPALEQMLERALRFVQEMPPSSRLGCEWHILPGAVIENLTTAVGDERLVDISQLLYMMRIIKSSEERALLRLGGQIARVGAEAFLDSCRPGVTELAIASVAVTAMNRALAALLPKGLSSSYAYCHAGDHTLTPHLHPSGRRLQPGEIVGLNVFPVISGYCMELERTVLLDGASDAHYEALAVTTEAFELGKGAVRPGVTCGHIDDITRQLISERGYGKWIRHGAGHAHGIMIGPAGREELGEIRSYNQNHFREGMVTSVEPGIYIPGLGGFRHSDVLAVTDEGAECLTEFTA